MNNDVIFAPVNEKPLDNIVEGYSHTSIFRTMAFIGDSLSSHSSTLLTAAPTKFQVIKIKKE